MHIYIYIILAQATEKIPGPASWKTTQRAALVTPQVDDDEAKF